MAENLAMHGCSESEHIKRTIVFGRQIDGRVGPVSFVRMYRKP